ncbi:hypothetical protein [Sulfitobacter geojensis]|uniref:hypothetical protein n=1 Tax=Sulfitobacter geojensis TaxID=1342299 RepID=UPI00248FDED1|nr:hypothetical protein [Sulfitobacter geojensis]
MFDDFTDGKIHKNTEDFGSLEATAQARVAEICAERGSDLKSRLRTHIALSMLNARLSYFGWAIRWDGSMFEVRLRAAVTEQKDDPEPLRGSKEDINQRARQSYISTGKIVDPQTGRVLPRSEGKRFGI